MQASQSTHQPDPNPIKPNPVDVTRTSHISAFWKPFLVQFFLFFFLLAYFLDNVYWWCTPQLGLFSLTLSYFDFPSCSFNTAVASTSSPSMISIEKHSLLSHYKIPCFSSSSLRNCKQLQSFEQNTGRKQSLTSLTQDSISLYLLFCYKKIIKSRVQTPLFPYKNQWHLEAVQQSRQWYLQSLKLSAMGAPVVLSPIMEVVFTLSLSKSSYCCLLQYMYCLGFLTIL